MHLADADTSLLLPIAVGIFVIACFEVLLRRFGGSRAVEDRIWNIWRAVTSRRNRTPALASRMDEVEAPHLIE